MSDEPVADKVEESDCRKLPTNFIDLELREWHVAFRPSLVTRLAEELRIDIWNANDLTEKGPLLALAGDERKLLKTLWILCEKQAKQLGMTQAAFEDGFAGGVFDAALEAIQGAILVFFSGARAAQFRKVIGQLEWLRANHLATIDELNAIAREAHSKNLENSKAEFRKEIEKQAPSLIRREISRSISSAFTEKPPAPSE